MQSPLLRVPLRRPAGRRPEAQDPLVGQLLANTPSAHDQHNKHTEAVQNVHDVRDQPNIPVMSNVIVEVGQHFQDPSDAGQGDQPQVQAESASFISCQEKMCIKLLTSKVPLRF